MNLSKDEARFLWNRLYRGAKPFPLDAGKPHADAPKPSKYGNTPTVVDGIRFQSQGEARYYQRLKVRQAAGEVLWFLRQTPFHLPGGTTYRCDFLEVHADGTVHVIDVKGCETQAFKRSKKQVEALYPIVIEVVPSRDV